MIGWVETSYATLSAGNATTLFGIPGYLSCTELLFTACRDNDRPFLALVLGPILGGTIGSCGGMFFPLDKGLKVRNLNKLCGKFFVKLSLFSSQFTRPCLGLQRAALSRASFISWSNIVLSNKVPNFMQQNLVFVEHSYFVGSVCGASLFFCSI